MIGPADSPSIRNVLASAEDFDIPHRVLDEKALTREYPQHRALPGEVAVLDEWAGVLRPEFAVLAAATAAQQHGARVVTGTTVTGLEPMAGGVRVHAGDRSWSVEQVLVTAGPWTNRFVPELTEHVLPNKLVMTWYHPRGSVADYLPDAFPIFIRETEDVHIFGIPTLDGGSVKVAPHASYGEMHDADELDRNVEPRDLERINSAVADLLPGLVPTPVRVASYMDGYTPDAHAIVGRDARRRQRLGARRLLRPRLQDGARLRARGRRPRHHRQDVVADRAPRPGTLPDLTSSGAAQVRAGLAGFTGSPAACRSKTSTTSSTESTFVPIGGVCKLRRGVLRRASTILRCDRIPARPGGHALVAQGIERRFPKPCVAGSNPAGGTDQRAAGEPSLSSIDSTRSARHSGASNGWV